MNAYIHLFLACDIDIKQKRLEMYFDQEYSAEYCTEELDE